MDKPCTLVTGTYRLNQRPVVSLTRCVLRVEGGTEPAIFVNSRIRIGRGQNNDLVIRDDSVSQYHCELVRTCQGFMVKDLTSANGTYVNSVQIEKAYVQPGDSIRLGRINLIFSTEEELWIGDPYPEKKLGRLIGMSLQTRNLFSLIQRIAPTDATILIQGETGTGKEVVAKTIHELSSRKDKPFVIVDCSAIPPTLMESELFGFEKGSFTGALSGRKGLLEQADQGTLFLDEIGELELSVQPKLLRFLETGQLRRIGRTRPVNVDARIIAATNRNLAAEVEAGRFRSDLFYRLNVISIVVPPLRDRPEDIEPLTEYFLDCGSFNRDDKGNKLVSGLAPQTLRLMKTYSWPGNVRELLNVLERGVALAGKGQILPEHLPAMIQRPEILQYSRPAKAEISTAPNHALIHKNIHESDSERFVLFKDAKEEAIQQFESNYLRGLLGRTGRNLSMAARMSGLTRKHLRYLLKKHNLYKIYFDEES